MTDLEEIIYILEYALDRATELNLTRHQMRIMLMALKRYYSLKSEREKGKTLKLNPIKGE